MAAKLCCVAEQESRPGTPELPNARVSQATPSNRPLLAQAAESPNSRFTSARSEDLLELRDLFLNATDQHASRSSPTRAPRAPFSRPSLYSLHSLHKMASMRSIIRRKFSKDLPQAEASSRPTSSAVMPTATSVEPGAIAKNAKLDLKQQLKLTMEDLRKDLLSDKRPDEGGYDPDAEMLDNMANDAGKKTPGKRPSIHSIEWTPSTGSKPTPELFTKPNNGTEPQSQLQPYHIQKPQHMIVSNPISPIFSTPNLRLGDTSERHREFRRSHSASSMILPQASPISPIRLPSLTDCNKGGKPWSEVINESLRLSQFPHLPQHDQPQASETTSVPEPSFKHECSDHGNSSNATLMGFSLETVNTIAPPAPQIADGRIRHSSQDTSPKASISTRSLVNPSPTKAEHDEEETTGEEETNARRSVHLYNMRISHHLRSGSLLSWDQLADATELPTPPNGFRGHTVPEQAQAFNLQKQYARHERQTSSSGFASSKVPSRWGKVLPNSRDLRPDVASSVYSSRPQSPPASFRGSMVNLSRAGTVYRKFSVSSNELQKTKSTGSFHTDDEDTPRPIRRYGTMNMSTTQIQPTENSSPQTTSLLARKNSVADTKTSKFREEFSPTPRKKKLAPSTSIMQFLHPKRLSIRSRSEANLQGSVSNTVVDGVSDTLSIPSAEKERRQSRSMISLQTEQEAHAKDKGIDQMWNRALKAHQEEKANMFLSENKDRALYAPPFRERSASIASRRISCEDDVSPDTQSSVMAKRHSAPLLEPLSAVSLECELPMHRRSAAFGIDDTRSDRELAYAFEKQGDKANVVGAWGSYPSHTRRDRAFSAGKIDHVDTRDFALESAIEFASGHDFGTDSVDPIDRLPSKPRVPGEKKRKKLSSGRMVKSNSMTFGRSIWKNYTKKFKNQSTEYRRHGQGHRSSIASGGILEFPELELLPNVWTSSGANEGTIKLRNRTHEHSSGYRLDGTNDERAEGTLPAERSMATLRPRRRSSAPDFNKLQLHDNKNAAEDNHDRARIWSVYYENCVSSFPRQSTELDFGLGEFRSSRASGDGTHGSMQSRAMSPNITRYAKDIDRVNSIRHNSQGSVRESIMSLDEDDGTGEEKSLVSVRRSTMDLISMFEKQEIAEHDKVLGITRPSSHREREKTALW
ncbi:hypothetical protein IQ07DRAFT_77570 [Pyrenochaeta sp. DS3sAY3a]|nr:hypothetical protein IQ07DRAFT_77570 [Pyrenochaeta sp. DS3sAY3a]